MFLARYQRHVLVNRACRWVFRLARGSPVPRKSMPVLTQFDCGETLDPRRLAKRGITDAAELVQLDWARGRDGS